MPLARLSLPSESSVGNGAEREFSTTGSYKMAELVCENILKEKKLIIQQVHSYAYAQENNSSGLHKNL